MMLLWREYLDYNLLPHVPTAASSKISFKQHRGPRRPDIARIQTSAKSIYTFFYFVFKANNYHR